MSSSGWNDWGTKRYRIHLKQFSNQNRFQLYHKEPQSKCTITSNLLRTLLQVFFIKELHWVSMDSPCVSSDYQSQQSFNFNFSCNFDWATKVAVLIVWHHFPSCRNFPSCSRSYLNFVLMASQSQKLGLINNYCTSGGH